MLRGHLENCSQLLLSLTSEVLGSGPLLFPLRIGAWRKRWQAIIAERLFMLDLQPVCMYEEKVADEESVHDV